MAPPPHHRVLPAVRPRSARHRMFVRTTIGLSGHPVPQFQRSWCSSSIAFDGARRFCGIGHRISGLMAYSSIGHMGFALVGLAAATSDGVEGVLFYMADLNLALTLAHSRSFWPCVAMARWVGRSVDLSGLAHSNPTMGFLLAMCCSRLRSFRRSPLSLPSFYVFRAATRPSLQRSPSSGRDSVVGAYYYLTIVKIMYFYEPLPGGFAPMAYDLDSARRHRAVHPLFSSVYPGSSCVPRRGGQILFLMIESLT